MRHIIFVLSLVAIACCSPDSPTDTAPLAAPEARSTPHVALPSGPILPTRGEPFMRMGDAEATCAASSQEVLLGGTPDGCMTVVSSTLRADPATNGWIVTAWWALMQPGPQFDSTRTVGWVTLDLGFDCETRSVVLTHVSTHDPQGAILEENLGSAPPGFLNEANKQIVFATYCSG